jgi:hypothetical protein
MEEELKLPDFDEWIKNYKPEPIVYCAAFDAETGSILAVGPNHTVNEKKYKTVIEIESDIAEKIITGEIRMNKCFIDPHEGRLEIIEVKDLFKIDDMLHRIIVKEWSKIKKPDIHLTHYSKDNKLIVELSEEYGGTFKQNEEVVKRKMFWDGETIMDFIITDYNDPNVITDNFSVKINELIGKSVELANLSFPKYFSVYTRRLFKNYMIEEK